MAKNSHCKLERKKKMQKHIIDLLNWCNQLNLSNGASILPYKIHQFIPQTGNVYLTIGDQASRQITVEEKLYCKELSHGDVKSCTTQSYSAVLVVMSFM